MSDPGPLPPLTPDSYAELRRRAAEDPAAFFGEAAGRLEWIAPFTQVKDVSFDAADLHVRWFADGVLNACSNCVDRWLPTRADETAIVQRHPVQGASIVEPLHSMKEVIPLIRSHHERIDGRGYPDGLRDVEIPRLVRILSVADVYDALSSKRPYRDAIPHGECLTLLRENALRGALDPEFVSLFSEALPRPPCTPAPRPSHTATTMLDFEHIS